MMLFKRRLLSNSPIFSPVTHNSKTRYNPGLIVTLYFGFLVSSVTYGVISVKKDYDDSVKKGNTDSDIDKVVQTTTVA